jgi:hypothetical protein
MLLLMHIVMIEDLLLMLLIYMNLWKFWRMIVGNSLKKFIFENSPIYHCFNMREKILILK